jgi:hypothetical protein
LRFVVRDVTHPSLFVVKSRCSNSLCLNCPIFYLGRNAD